MKARRAIIDAELSDELTNDILIYLNKGDKASLEDDYAHALQQYEQALLLLPLPHTRWPIANFVYAAIGGLYLLKQDLEKAIGYYVKASQCPDGVQPTWLG